MQDQLLLSSINGTVVYFVVLYVEVATNVLFIIDLKIT